MKLDVFMERARLARRAKQADRVERRREFIAFVAAHPLCSQEELAVGMGVSMSVVRAEMPLLIDKVLPAYGRKGSGIPVRYIVKKESRDA